MKISNEVEFRNQLSIAVKKGLEKKYKEIGKIVCKNLGDVMEQSLGKKTTKVNNIKFKIEGNEIIIYTKDPVVTYIEYGTKPHIIRPKFKQALKFQVKGETVITKEVHHPGTKAKPFIRQGLFISKPEIQNILNK